MRYAIPVISKVTMQDAQPPQQGAAPVQVLWFAQSQKDGRVSLYQATVLGRPTAPDAAATFFDGLRLP